MERRGASVVMMCDGLEFELNYWFGEGACLSSWRDCLTPCFSLCL